MKVLVFLLTLVLCQLSPTQAWQNNILTATDCEQIFYASGKQCISLQIVKEVRRDHKGTLYVILHDNTLMVFQHGESRDILTKSEPSQENWGIGRKEQDHILDKFMSTWYQTETKPDMLTEQQLNDADMLMFTFVWAATHDQQTEALNMKAMGSRGNRYIKRFAFATALFFSPEHEANFWGTYIGSAAARKEDVPDDQEKRDAIQKLRGLFERNNLDYRIEDSVKKEIKRLDPLSYDVLKDKLRY